MNADLIALIDDLAKQHQTSGSAGELSDWWGVLSDLGLTTIGLSEDHGGSGGDFLDLLSVVYALSRHGRASPLPEVATASWASSTPPESGEQIAVPILVKTLPAEGSVVRDVPWPLVATAAVAVDTTGAAATLGLDKLSADDAPFALIGSARVTSSSSATGAKIDRARLEVRLAALTAARLAGAAEGAFLLTKQYVKERVQFGKPLIEIPSVAINLAKARTAVLESSVAVNSMPGDADPHATAVARVVSGRCASEVARIAHQLHGAMGTTEEYGLGRFSRIIWGHRDDAPSSLTSAEALGRAVIAGGEPEAWVLTRARVDG